MEYKTQANGDAARAARREQARAELERCDLEARTAQAEAELRRARLAELRAQNDELGRYVTEQQLRQVDEEIAARERREQLMQEARRLVNEPLPQVPRSEEEIRAELDELGRFLDREALAEQDRLRAQTDAALSRCIYEPGYRRRWLRSHPGGVDHCSCDGCRAYRREPPR
jgi:hypothetical protein